MRLVAVTTGDRQVDQRTEPFGSSPTKNVLKAEHAAIGLRRQADRARKQRDEPSMTVSALSHDVTNGVRRSELLKGACNGWMKPSHDREPPGQHALERVEPFLG
jgi:hypothetical protein